MGAGTQGVRIEFLETMAGFAAAAPNSYETGYESGEAQGQAMAIQVKVDVPDVDRFVAEPGHQGQLSGSLSYAPLGGECPVVQGWFGLLTDTADANRKCMSYRLHCNTPEGRAITFDGVKRVQHDTPIDLWPDTTTLYVNVYEGHIDPLSAAAPTLLFAGILKLGLAEFVRLLGTLSAKNPDGSDSLEGLLTFGRYFAGRLAEVYCQGLPPAPEEAQRRYGAFTLEGVPEAEKTLIPFQTEDKLSLLLTRFKRGSAPCKDVVLLTHGMTSATNMFVMPEHRNFVTTLLDHGYTDVWALDHRGSCRFPYNLRNHRFNLDDIVQYDYPAALEEVRRQVGPEARIHVVAHCLGAMTTAMALAAGKLPGVRSAVLSSVGLTPAVPLWSRLKLAVGPWAADYLLGVEYFNPSWRRQPGLSLAKGLAWVVDLVHRECKSSECHMLSFMWGKGAPAVFQHENLLPVTHDRLGDLFGGTGVHYYRHVLKMVRARNRAVKMLPGDPRYRDLPDDYLALAGAIQTPMLLAQGQENRIFFDSNLLFHQRLEEMAPGRHELAVFPRYGHQDLFIGKNADRDVFPRFIDFLKAHSHD